MFKVNNLTGFGVATTTGGYDSSAAAYFDRTTNMTDACKDDINDLVIALKQAGYWGQLDVLCVAGDATTGATDAEPNGLLNIVQDAYNATNVGTTPFVVDQGWSPNVTGTKYIDSNFQTISGVTKHAAQDNSKFVYARTVAPSPGVMMGVRVGSIDDALYNGFGRAYFESQNQIVGANDSSVGAYFCERNSFTDFSIENPGGKVTAVGSAYSMPTGYDYFVGARNNNGSPNSFATGGQIAAWALGSSGISSSGFNSILQAYFVARGTSV